MGGETLNLLWEGILDSFFKRGDLDSSVGEGIFIWNTHVSFHSNTGQ